jgi:hypothetical protein
MANPLHENDVLVGSQGTNWTVCRDSKLPKKLG